MNQVGIDISSEVFDATMQHVNKVVRKQFSNTKTGHHQFIEWALRQANSAQISLEATGIYHLQLALALDQHPNIDVMVVNPCAARRFAQAHMVRAKTDAIDALMVCCNTCSACRSSPGQHRVKKICNYKALLIV